MTAIQDMVQLNVRMERSLREAGNAALADMGYAPSEYIRELWSRLAEGRGLAVGVPGRLIGADGDGSAEHVLEEGLSDAACDASGAPYASAHAKGDDPFDRMYALIQSRSSFADAYYQLGLEATPHIRDAHDELEEAVARHYLSKEGLLD